MNLHVMDFRIYANFSENALCLQIVIIPDQQACSHSKDQWSAAKIIVILVRLFELAKIFSKHIESSLVILQ